MTKRVVAVLAAIWTIAGVSSTAQQTWTGVVSDSLCNMSHARMAQIVIPPLDDPACVFAVLHHIAGNQFFDAAGYRDRRPDARGKSASDTRRGCNAAQANGNADAL